MFKLIYISIIFNSITICLSNKIYSITPGNMITVESNYEDKIVKTISFSIKYLSISMSVQH